MPNDRNSGLAALFLVPAIGAVMFGICLPSYGAVTDACAVVTQGDAEAALGEPVSAPRRLSHPSTGGEAPGCRYRAARGSALEAKTVSVTIHYDAAGRGNLNAIVHSEEKAGYKSVREVDGVGDAAVWGVVSSLGRMNGELSVRKGSSTLLVIILGGISDEPAALKSAKDLAAKALPRL